jgi:hypothetical protein
MTKGTMTIKELINQQKPKECIIISDSVRIPASEVMNTVVADLKDYQWQYYMNTLEIYL